MLVVARERRVLKQLLVEAGAGRGGRVGRPRARCVEETSIDEGADVAEMPSDKPNWLTVDAVSFSKAVVVTDWMPETESGRNDSADEPVSENKGE